MNVNVARRRLEAEWERLLVVEDAVAGEHLGQASEQESSGELSSIDQHQADLGSEVLEREMDFSIRDRVDSELRDLYDAFRRLELGTYGRCESCGIAIPESRLAAAPAARFCVEHERLWELHAMATPFPEDVAPEDAVSAESIAEQEAIHHLEFLSDDDDVEEHDELGAEEAALHYTGGESHLALDPAEVEAAEATQWAEALDDQAAADLEEVDLRRQAEAVATEEEELVG